MSTPLAARSILPLPPPPPARSWPNALPGAAPARVAVGRRTRARRRHLLDDDGVDAYGIPEFCRRHHISGSFYKLKT